MQIEIVNFYPAFREDDKQFLQGTLHVYLIDLGIDIRGVFVSKKRDTWHFSMPFRKMRDAAGNLIQYPSVIFRDREKNNQLMQSIKEKGKVFIEAYLKANPQPIKPTKFAEQVKYETNKPERKETAPNAKKAMPVETVPSKKVLWQDMPKKSSTKNMSKGNYAGRK
jgi:hypothetical protein